MYCSKCGAVNNDNAVICINCKNPVAAEGNPVQPPPVSVANYLVPAILVTIFCCWPFGIPAIIFAAKVNGLAATGNVAGAIEAANKAKMWCWISFGLGLAIGLIYAVVMIASIAAGA